jgi:lycopene cyclase CruA
MSDRGLLRERLGAEMEERLEHLDASRLSRPVDLVLPTFDGHADTDTDVLLAGGGLSLLLAWALARRGVRVVVVERAKAGVGHREWNASDSELRALIAEGLVDEPTLEELVAKRYRHGFCRFHGGGSYPVTNVLDVAVDAARLLSMAREECTRLGVRFLDRARVTGLGPGRNGVSVRVDAEVGVSDLSAKIVLDARGSASPYGGGDLVCPTVGGVLRGLREGDGPREIDPTVGEILVTTEPADEGARQHVWEGFPARNDESTVYLFYYAAPGRRTGETASLRALYTRFFETLPTYKEGHADLVRPTFGVIPGASRLGPAPRPPHPRVGLVGDAAARHSPLTFCGFGAMLRSVPLVRSHVMHALLHDTGLPDPIVHDTEVHGWTGGLARLMASGTLHGDAQNRLLDAAFSSLHAMGDAAYGALLRDEAYAADFVEFLARTSVVRPRAYVDAARGLGARGVAKWAARLAASVLFGAARPS